MSSVNNRALKRLRDFGFHPWKVECYNAASKRTTDLYGIIDYIGIATGGIIGVQVTSRSNHSDRVKKIMANQYAPVWLTNAELEVWSWGYMKSTRKYEFRRTQFIYGERSHEVYAQDVAGED